MGGLGVKVQHFPLTLLVVLTTLTLPCERDLAYKNFSVSPFLPFDILQLTLIYTLHLTIVVLETALLSIPL